MEVIEHVADSQAFIELLAGLVRPGGMVVLSTINRTIKSYFYAIFVAEHVLRLLPRGTHQWRKFLTPEEIRIWMQAYGLEVVNVSGATLNLRTREMQLSSDVSVNYLLASRPEQSIQHC
jgi:2-polyprenyl-6-hydroxyphenyl methylase/3-demethylubiquinone-9 3-methyltransferase